jgi:hypothetical protein
MFPLPFLSSKAEIIKYNGAKINPGIGIGMKKI